jgi:hypothetical protein
LLPALALAFLIAFIPNLHYSYPVYIDEWVHAAHSEALLKAGGLDYPDPFSGAGTTGLVGLLLPVALLAAFYSLHYGIDLIYLRGILFMLLVFGIVAGAGLMAIKNLELPERLKAAGFLKRIGYPLCFILVAVILVIAIPARLNTPYYPMIDDADYQTFVWIKENIDNSFQKAILDPWKATPFAVITGKYVFTRIHVGPDATSLKADEFLASGCADTKFLKDNGISIVCTDKECRNPALIKVWDNVYLLKK